MRRPLRLVLRASALLVLVVACALGAAWWWVTQQPLPLPSSPYIFDVRSGATLRSIARDFPVSGILPHPTPLIALARILSADRGIKAGNYEVVSGIPLLQLLEKLTQGEVTQTSLTLVE